MHIKLGKKISSLYYFITATKIARIATKHNNDKKKSVDHLKYTNVNLHECWLANLQFGQ